MYGFNGKMQPFKWMSNQFSLMWSIKVIPCSDGCYNDYMSQDAWRANFRYPGFPPLTHLMQILQLQTLFVFISTTIFTINTDIALEGGKCSL